MFIFQYNILHNLYYDIVLGSHGHNIKLISNFLPKIEEKTALMICTNININLLYYRYYLTGSEHPRSPPDDSEYQSFLLAVCRQGTSTGI